MHPNFLWFDISLEGVLKLIRHAYQVGEIGRMLDGAENTKEVGPDDPTGWRENKDLARDKVTSPWTEFSSTGKDLPLPAILFSVSKIAFPLFYSDIRYALYITEYILWSTESCSYLLNSCMNFASAIQFSLVYISTDVM